MTKATSHLSKVPENISPVCFLYGEHDYCTDVDWAEKRFASAPDLTYLEVTYCDCDCHFENNGIYIPSVDDTFDTSIVE